MDDYQEFYFYNTIYENTKIQTLSLQCVNFATKSRIIRWFFKFLRWVSKLLYRHMHDGGFIFYIPICIYVIAIFYDFLNMKIYYTYYLFFPLYFIILLRQYLKFLNQKSPYIDNKLSQYYSTDTAGKTYVSTKVTGLLHLRFNIFDESVISYVLNDLYKKNSLENYNLNKKGDALYRRVFFIIICFILSIYLIKKYL